MAAKKKYRHPQTLCFYGLAKGNVPLALGKDPKLGDEGDEEEEGQVAEDDVGGRHRRQNGLRREGGCWAKDLPGTREGARL